MWLSLVERYVRDVEVASSNLVTSTIEKGHPNGCPFSIVETALDLTWSMPHKGGFDASSVSPRRARRARSIAASVGIFAVGEYPSARPNSPQTPCNLPDFMIY